MIIGCTKLGSVLYVGIKNLAFDFMLMNVSSRAEVIFKRSSNLYDQLDLGVC